MAQSMNIGCCCYPRLYVHRNCSSSLPGRDDSISPAGSYCCVWFHGGGRILDVDLSCPYSQSQLQNPATMLDAVSANFPP